MYADRMTESMQVAIEETNRRRGVQEAYNREHGIEPVTIVKEIRDINDRLRAVAEAPGAYRSETELSEMSTKQVEKLVSQLEAEMRSAARQLEFERAAALRDELQQIRLRVLEQDASVAVARAAERAAASAPDALAAGPRPGGPARRGRAGRGRRDRAQPEGSGVEVTAVTVLPAQEEPAATLDGHVHVEGDEHDENTAADWFPGIRDEHEGDDAGWMARWLERPTWDRRVTPNVIKRSGTRPRRRR